MKSNWNVWLESDQMKTKYKPGTKVKVTFVYGSGSAPGEIVSVDAFTRQVTVKLDDGQIVRLYPNHIQII